MKRVAAVGLTAAVAYVAVVVGTALVTERDVRPLFDAIGPPPVYRWVKPPPDFAAGNLKPKPVDIRFSVKPGDPPPTGASEDQQIVFSLPAGALAPPPGDDAAVATVEPLDPDTLGALAARTFADGNAYRISLRSEPSGQPLTVMKPGSVLITVPVPATGVVYSPDGQTWRVIASRHASANTVGAEMPGAGYYLATSPDVIGFSKGGGGGRLLLPIVVTVIVAAALVGAPVLARRRRGRR